LPVACRGSTTSTEPIVMRDGDRLSPRRSLALRNHSPDGFNWGYPGSGPAQLALGLLLDFLDGEPDADDRALHHYQDFKFKVIARLDGDKGWQLSGQQIRLAIEALDHARPFIPDPPILDDAADTIDQEARQ
jgi:hypothetical protein